MNYKHLTLVLALVSLVLCLCITACTPSATPAPPATPTTPTTPSTSPSTQPETQLPSQPAQEESGIAALNLVDEPLPEKKLDVEMVYSGGDQPGLCYLGSYAMLARYNDSAIDFTSVVANSGIGVSSRYIPQANLLIGGFSIGCIGTAAGNQGYEYYISALKGADITDTFLAADFPANAEEVAQVENGEDALTLLKRLISSEIPAMVHVDTFYIKEPLKAHTSYWQTIFNYMGSKHIDHYMTVTGYDGDYVFLNDPTEKASGKGADIPVKTGDFMKAWENGNSPDFEEGARIGPYWMLFLGKRGEAKSIEQLLSWSKDIGAGAGEEIRKAANNPNIIDTLHCNEMYRARKEFGAFLERNGYEEAGTMFSEAAKLYKGLCQSSNPGADLGKIADIEEQALTKF